MKPVEQQVTGPAGDCFRACIASLLERTLAEVPLFPNDSTQWDAAFVWLWEQGYELAWGSEQPQGEHYIASVPSPTMAHLGLFHAVIGRDGSVVWDPHPERERHVLGAPEWYETIRPRGGEP